MVGFRGKAKQTMSNCLLDVVIAVDLSVSTGLPGLNSFHGGAIYEGERRLLESIVQSLNSKMQAQEAQVGLVFFEGDPDHRVMYTDQKTMTNNTTGSLNTMPSSSNPGGLSNLSANVYDCAVTNRPTSWSQAPWSTATDNTKIPGGIRCALAGGGCYANGVINEHISPPSSLGDRSADPDLKKVLIVISGAHNTPPVDPNDLTAEFGFINQNAWPGLTGLAHLSTLTAGCRSQSNSLSAFSNSTGSFSTSGPSNQLVIGVVVGDKDINNLSSSLGGMTQDNRDQILSTLDAITCVQNGLLTNNGDPLGFYVDANNSDIPAVANAIKSEICSSVVRTYNCSGINGVSGISPWQCYDPGTGLGTYTATTALQGGYSNALSECLSSDCRERQTTIDDAALSGTKLKFCKLVELCPCRWLPEMITPEPGTLAAQNVLENPRSQCREPGTGAVTPTVLRCIGSDSPIAINDAWIYNANQEYIVNIISTQCEPCNLGIRSTC